MGKVCCNAVAELWARARRTGWLLRGKWVVRIGNMWRILPSGIPMAGNPFARMGFLLHSLPKGFVRIRHYGLLANRVRQQNLECCRRLIGHSTAGQLPAVSSQTHPACDGQNTPDWACPKCGQGEMRFVELLPSVRAGPMVA